MLRIKYRYTRNLEEIYKDKLHSQYAHEIQFIETLNSCDKKHYSLSFGLPSDMF